jgi:type IV pilus assembly protein PilF
VAFLQRVELAWQFLTILVLEAATSACSGRNPNSPVGPERRSQVEYDIARDYYSKGQPRLALQHCRSAVELDDQNADAAYFASVLHLSFCNQPPQELQSPDCHLPDAEKYARNALSINPKFRDAENTLGQVLILEKRYPEAIAVLEPLTKDPAFESANLAWGNLGWAQVLAGRVNEGIESLKNAITEPRFCVGHYRLGVAFEKKGDLPSAEQSLTNALSVDDPKCKGLQDAWYERGLVRMKLGKAADARGDFARCRDIAGDTAAGKACAEALAQNP